MAPSSSKSTGNKREELMSIIKNGDIDEFISSSKSSSNSELCDALAELNKSHLQDFWECVYGLCTQTLMSDKEVDDRAFAERMYRVLKATTDFAQATVSALQGEKGSDEEKASAKVPQFLQDTVILLHGMLSNLEESQVVLKNQMSRLFEDWWHQDLGGRQELAPNTLRYLLTRSLQIKSSQMDVTRVWAVRGMLECTDLNDPDNASIVASLQQCTHHPQYLAITQGIKFLAFIFTLNPDLTDKLHQCVKTFIFTTPNSWHGKYGEVYFRSWQMADEEMKRKIEESCVQDWMFRAVHACRQGTHNASAALLRLMSYFHKQKTQRGVEAMLSRLYGPILWRSLKVPNSDVRLNAAALMFSVFPLQDPGLLKEEADAALQRQFDLMNSLLMDPVVEMRVMAVLGVGKVLCLYWELIPIQVIQALVTCLVQDMIYDSSAPAVREAVLKVMYQMCDNHLCIPMLKKVLPEIGNFIHDNSERVRVAMLDLLLKVKGMRAIKYWSIVPVEHILARLETDSHLVTRRIMSLISASFVPVNQPPSQQVERCLALINSNPGAARKFFMSLPKSLGVVDTTKYILVLCRYALESTRLWAKTSSDQSVLDESAKDSDTSDVAVSKKSTPKGKKRKTRSSLATGNVEGEDNSSVERGDGSEAGQDEGSVDLSFNMDYLSGMMEGVYLMFTAIISELSSPEHAAMKEGLMKKLSVTVRELIRFSQDTRLEQALIGLGGHLPSRAMPLVSQSLFKKLKHVCSANENVLDSSEDEAEITCLVKALVQWGRGTEVIELVKEAVSDFLAKESDASPSKSSGAKLSPKGGRKKVAFNTVKESVVDINKALKVFSTMLSNAECRPVLMTKHKKHLVSLVNSFEKKIYEKLQGQLQLLAKSSSSLDKGNGRHKKKAQTEPDTQASVLVSIFSMFLRLTVFMIIKPDTDNNNSKENDQNESNVEIERECNENEDCVFFRNSLSWIGRVVLPQLSTDTEKSQQFLDLASSLVVSVLRASSGLIMVGFRDKAVLEQVAVICSSVLELPLHSLRNSLLEKVIVFAYQVTMIRQVDNGLEPMDENRGVSHEKENEKVGSGKLCSSPLECPLDFGLSIFQSAYAVIVKRLESDCSKKSSDSVLVTTTYQPMGEMLMTLIKSRINSEVNDKATRVVPRLMIGELETLSRLEQIDAEQKGLHQSLLSSLKKTPTVLRSFVYSFEEHLHSEDVTIHSLHGLTSLVDVLQSGVAEEMSSDLKKAVRSCCEKITPSGVDEDVFRDVRAKLDQKLEEWSAS